MFMKTGEFPDLPDEDLDGLAGEPLSEDPDSEENALSSIELPPVEETQDFGEIERLDDLISEEIRAILANYRWENIETMTTAEMLEFCERLGIEPEVLGATIVIEDIGFAIEEKNYDSRAVSRSVSLEDIVDESSNIEDAEKWQEDATMKACLRLNDFVSDPLLQKYKLLDARVQITKKIDEAGKTRPKDFDEYIEKEKVISDMQAEQQVIENAIEELIGIEAVTKRRERAIRRMAWLVGQEYMGDAINDFKVHYKSMGTTPTLRDLAEALAGKWTDVFSVAEDAQSEDQAQNTIGREKVPGIIDKLIDEHAKNMTNQSGKTNVDRENEALMLHRLIQAKGICINVFDNDLEDGIYQPQPITRPNYNMLQFVSRRLYIHADDEILSSFISFLPGSNLRRLSITEIEEIPLQRFSGRSTKDVFIEVDSIIDSHPTLDRQKIEDRIRTFEEDEFGSQDIYPLFADAYRILEKLVYKEKHTADTLVSP